MANVYVETSNSVTSFHLCIARLARLPCCDLSSTWPKTVEATYMYMYVRWQKRCGLSLSVLQQLIRFVGILSVSTVHSPTPSFLQIDRPKLLLETPKIEISSVLSTISTLAFKQTLFSFYHLAFLQKSTPRQISPPLVQGDGAQKLKILTNFYQISFGI